MYIVESDNDSIRYYLSQGNLEPNPNDLEQPHSFNQSRASKNAFSRLLLNFSNFSELTKSFKISLSFS